MDISETDILYTPRPVKGHAGYCTEPLVRAIMPELILEHYGWVNSIEYDLVCLGGGGGGFTTLNFDNRGNVMLNDIRFIGLGAHHGKEILIFNHQSCGAYKLFAGISFTPDQKEIERQYHHSELKNAAAFLRGELPGTTIHLGYVFKTGNRVQSWDIEHL